MQFNVMKNRGYNLLTVEFAMLTLFDAKGEA